MKTWSYPIIYALAGSTLSLGVYAGAQEAVRNLLPGETETASGAETASVFEEFIQRDGMSVLDVKFFSGGDLNYDLPADQEMDVYTIVINNGFQNSSSDTGTFQIILDGVDVFFSTQGFGTESITLGKPLKLREGDTLRFRDSDDNVSESIDVALIGTPPQSSQVKIY